MVPEDRVGAPRHQLGSARAGLISTFCSPPSHFPCLPAPPGAGSYFVYYLAFVQNSGGASTTFTWQGCNSTDPTEANPCVLGRRRLSSTGASVCLAATPAAAVVARLEGRTAFDAFTDMEMMAAPAEAAATAAALQARGRPAAEGG